MSLAVFWEKKCFVLIHCTCIVCLICLLVTPKPCCARLPQSNIKSRNLSPPFAILPHPHLPSWLVVFSTKTRPSVNYAEDKMDQSFLFPGLVWSVNGFHLWMWSLGGISQPFFWVLGHFRTYKWLILEQPCSWPVRGQSSAAIGKWKLVCWGVHLTLLGRLAEKWTCSQVSLYNWHHIQGRFWNQTTKSMELESSYVPFGTYTGSNWALLMICGASHIYDIVILTEPYFMWSSLRSASVAFELDINTWHSAAVVC